MMAIGPRLDLRQTQSLVMTPQLQQAIKLLALSNLELQSFVAQALESNPLLDREDPAAEADAPGEERREERAEALEAPETLSADRALDLGPGEADAALDLDAEAYARDGESGGARGGEGGTDAAGGADSGDWSAQPSALAGADEAFDPLARAASPVSLAQHLERQIGASRAPLRTQFIARHIVGLLDEAGYLRFDLREIAGDLDCSVLDVERALALVQTLDPTGVGARDLGECLALQAREADRYDPAMAQLLDHLDLVARGDLARLKRLCRVNDEDLAQMLSELRGYDPKPGLAFGAGDEPGIVPDVLVREDKHGNFSIAINEETLPRLVVNRAYALELREGRCDKETARWLDEKLADAHWLIKALDQRQKTILKTATEIVKHQRGFFREGVGALKPLTLREVAERIAMHESTISRVTSNKYLACARGTFELKYFFSSGVSSSDGEGASAEAIKARIKALTDAEDPNKILSDDKLVALLKAEGFQIARRTVAKYREAAGIGSSVERRRQKKLAQM